MQNNTTDNFQLNQIFLYSETATAIEPLKYQLNQLDKQIIEHQQAIDELRGKLIMDEQKLQKIFSD